MQVNLYNQSGQEVGVVSLADGVFNLKENNDLLHQVVTSQKSNQRQLIAHTKDRSEVRGGGKKPWRQKGTGRARHGSIRSPIWKGGGATFGPRNEKIYKKKINQKMAQKALGVALSGKLRSGQLIVIDDLKLSNIKTKEMAVVVKSLKSIYSDSKPTSSLLVVTPGINKEIVRTTKNLANIGAEEARNLNALKVLSYKYVVLLKESAPVLEKSFN